METINTPHDRGYKWLLSSREIFLQLLKSFIHQPWINEINENEVRRSDKSFISKDFMEKEADLVYEVKLHGQTVIFYILLELQRKVDFSMPYRLLNYMNGIWQNHLSLLPKNEGMKQKNFRLPAIVPIVLYNGEKPWTAATSFRKIIAGEERFGTNLLSFDYILLDVARYENDELLHLSNTIGAAFLLDKNSRNGNALRNLLKRLLVSLQNTPEAEFIIFLRWLRFIIQPRLSPDQQDFFEMDLTQLSNKEVRKMVFSNLEKSLDNIEEEGRMKEKIDTALEMLRDKINAETVAKYTKLPLDKIHDLRNKI